MLTLAGSQTVKVGVRFRMKTLLRIIKWGCIALIVMVAGCFIIGQVVIRIPQTHATKSPMTLSDFTHEFGVTNLPPTASNIYYATSTLGMGFAGARLYRFEAPVSDCFAYAANLIEGNNAETDDAAHKAARNLTPIASSPEPIHPDTLKAYGLKKVHWFDVEGIAAGVEGRGPPMALAQIWIDTKRGRFYYYWTD